MHIMPLKSNAFLRLFDGAPATKFCCDTLQGGRGGVTQGGGHLPYMDYLPHNGKAVSRQPAHISGATHGTEKGQ